MNRTDRLYAIVESLRAAGGRGRTAQALADRFEVSVRTIKRDVQALVEAGTAIRSQDGRGGGYQLERHAQIAPLTFTAGEATAVAVALAAEPQMPFRAEGRTALAKLLRAMPSETRDEASDIAARVWMRSSSSSRPRTARVVDEALRRRVVLHIEYVDEQGRVTKDRPVEPMALARTEGRWFLLAWCRLRKGGRSFHLERIRAARLTREPVLERDLRAVFGAPPDDAQPVRW